ncbi:MAG: cation:proton antiporter [Longimicrobiales bacterium]|nr:cation:proton antiporter [Longimicrobiales bacterium]
MGVPGRLQALSLEAGGLSSPATRTDGAVPAMYDDPLVRELGLILATAAVFALLARRLHIPTIVAYIAAGLLLGPVTGVLQATHGGHGAGGVALLSEVGIALLLFLVGLELSFAAIREVGWVAVVSGTVQVLVSAGGGFALSLLLGFAPLHAAFLGVALAFSSTVVVVKLLDRRGDLGETYGRIALGILLVQDLMVVVALTVVSGLGREGVADAAQLVRQLGMALAGMLVLVGVSVGASTRLLPRPFAWIGRSPEALLVWSLTWCFLLILGAKAMDLSLELGAFLAGVSLAQLPFNQELRRRVDPLVNFFLAVFFVALGVSMDPAAAWGNWPAVLALLAFVMIGKPAVLLAVIPRLGYGERVAGLAGLTLAQTSEFSFVLAGLGLTAGLIDAEVLSLIGVLGLASMGLSSAVILRSRRVYARLRALGLLRIFRAPHEGRLDRVASEARPGAVGVLRGHVVVVGMNALGRRIVEGLRSRGEGTLAIDLDPDKLARVPGPTLLGNAEDLQLLEAAGLRHAKLVVSALQIEDANNLLAYRARTLGVPAAIHAFDRSVVEDLHRLGVTHLIDSKTAGARRLGEALRDEGVYG